MKIAVIGAGFGGMSAAAYLAKAGHEVDVYERNAAPGGRAYVIEEHGYIFNLGPCWYTMPDVYEEFFADFGKKPSDYYRLEQLAPSYRAYFSDTKHLDVRSAPAVFKDFDQLQPGAGENLSRFLEHARHEYSQIRRDIMTLNGLHRRQLARPGVLEMLANPQFVGNFHQRVSRVSGDERLQKIMEFMVVLLGESPKTVPGLYNMLAWIDFGLGIWYPRGGFAAVARAFEQLAKEQGALFHYGVEVEKIHTASKRATGITVNGEYKDYHSIVAGADYPHVEMQLLDEQVRTYGKKQWQGKTFSNSAIIATVGVGKRLRLQHHNLFFDTAWYRNIDDLFKKHRLNERPLFYLNAPSVNDASVAPEGHENLQFMLPVSNQVKITKRKQESLVNGALGRVEEALGEKFKNDITVKHIFGPEYFGRRFHAYDNSAFGLSHTLLQSGPLRPRMQSKKVPNLYFVGQDTNPGTGVPLVVLSGKMIADVIKNA